MFADTLLALGLVLVVEGLAYALAPSLVERLLMALRQMPPDALRLLGLTALVGGTVLIWLAKRLGA